MKIAIITNDTAGLMLFREDLLLQLIKEGHSIVALTPFGNRVEDLERLGIKLIETPMSRRGTNPLKDINLFFKYLRVIKNEQVNYVITYTIKPNIYGGICSKLLHLKYAANITGLGTGFYSSRLRVLLINLYRFSLSKAKVVFCENSTIKDDIINLDITDESKVHVLNGAGVNLEKFSYQEYPHNSIFTFLFIGRVMKEKGIEELISAIQRLNKNGFECKLIIVGKYEEDYSNSFRDNSYIRFEGTKTDVRPYIKECDCFVLPSYHEGMANTNLECAASGRPLITSNIPGCREAVKDGLTGLLCEAKNTESLYNSMKRMMLLGRQDREIMGKAGRKHMEDHFDKRMVVNETIDALFS